MVKKTKNPSHSQILGIIWLSVALLLIAAIVFFSSRHRDERVTYDTTDVLHEAILTSQEDSIYRERRHKQYNTHSTNREISTNSTFYTTVPPARTKQPLIVELNTADTLTLQLLHGIGPAYASRIVRYRERMGGFVDKSQLMEVYGFTPELLAHIAPYLRLDTSAVKRININSVGLKQLSRHPYVEYFQARDIVQLRNHGIRFHGADDLRTIPSISDSTLQRLLPYLDFSDIPDTI